MSEEVSRGAAPVRLARRRAAAEKIMLSYGFLLLLLVLRLASDETAIAAYVGLAFYAGFGRVHVIRALTLSWFFTMMNPGLSSEGNSAAVGRYLVILGAAASIFARSFFMKASIKLNSFILYSMCLGGVLVVHSELVSPLPDVSILKAVTWTVVVSTLLACWLGMNSGELHNASRELFGGLVALLIMSLPLLIHPIGFLRNGWGFQGVLNHPQAFGPVMALLGAWLAARILAEPRPSWISIGLFGVCCLLVFLSGARTAGIGMVAAVGLGVALAPFLSAKRVRVLFPGLRSPRIWFIFVCIVLCLLIAAPFLSKHVATFLSKNSDSDSLLAAYESSRGALIDKMVYNIFEYPYSGIGFGIASDYSEMQIERDGILGLPLSAPVEKGVVFLALIEELGIIVGGLFIVWMCVVLKSASMAGVPTFCVCIVIFLFNFGESTLFSPGGMGLFWLIFLTLGYAAGRPGARRHA